MKDSIDHMTLKLPVHVLSCFICMKMVIFYYYVRDIVTAVITLCY